MDKIFLHGLKADTLIGVYDWEREQQQTLILDLDIGTAARSGASDSIDDTIHYGEVCDAVRQSLSNQTFIARSAGRVCGRVADTGLRRVVGTGAGGEARYSAQCTRSRRGN